MTGVCVADCGRDPDACEAFDGAICVQVGSEPSRVAEDSDGGVDDAGSGNTAFCFERCNLGVASPAKCHGQSSIGCEAISPDAPTTGFCRPICTHDSQCPERACDRKTGACLEGPPRIDETFGDSCDPASPDACDGLCVELTEGKAVCSHRCVFGESGDCAMRHMGRPVGGCLFNAPEGGLRDVGFCGELCECPEDCGHTAAVCDGFTSEELVRVFGRSGVCVPEALTLGEALSCQ